jgi:hypothetical protein
MEMTSPDTQRVDVARLAELLKLATPGPWHCAEISPPATGPQEHAILVGPRTVSIDRATAWAIPDARLMIAAVNALPALLLQVAELEETLSNVRYRRETADAFGEQCMADIDGLLARAEAAERAREAAFSLLAWFAANPYDYRNMADKCNEAAAFLAANGTSHDEGGVK